MTRLKKGKYVEKMKIFKTNAGEQIDSSINGLIQSLKNSISKKRR